VVFVEQVVPSYTCTGNIIRVGLFLSLVIHFILQGFSSTKREEYTKKTYLKVPFCNSKNSGIQSRCIDRNVSLFFHCFENPTVLHAIQSWSSDQNVPLSFHCFENLTVLHAIQSWSSDQNVPLSHAVYITNATNTLPSFCVVLELEHKPDLNVMSSKAISLLYPAPFFFARNESW
jgi:tellurite resistance-related uncharacterized protein